MDKMIRFGLYQSCGNRGIVGCVSRFLLRWCRWCMWRVDGDLCQATDGRGDVMSM